MYTRGLYSRSKTLWVHGRNGLATFIRFLARGRPNYCVYDFIRFLTSICQLARVNARKTGTCNSNKQSNCNFDIKLNTLQSRSHTKKNFNTSSFHQTKRIITHKHEHTCHKTINQKESYAQTCPIRVSIKFLSYTETRPYVNMCMSI